jgi:hypothetical protein
VGVTSDNPIKLIIEVNFLLSDYRFIALKSIALFIYRFKYQVIGS